jgi:hypothetical protein
MQEQIGYRLPNSQAWNHAAWDQPKPVINESRDAERKKKPNEGLRQKNTRANQDQQLDGRRDEASPVEANARRAEPSTHVKSVRRPKPSRQNRILNSCEKSRLIHAE